VRPGFEGTVIDAGLVLYVDASKSNHESKDAIKAALNNYASKTGLANNINQRLKQITVDPSKFGPSTGPNQYFQQANQLIRNINALTEKVNEAYALEEDPVEKINKLFKKGS
jgi:molybdenum-dependent DNA-binding transcriptional regulator ModE